MNKSFMIISIILLLCFNFSCQTKDAKALTREEAKPLLTVLLNSGMKET
jgi:hypothetical protein